MSKDILELGDKIKWFSSSDGWQRGELLSFPKNALDEFCLVKADSGERGYIDFNCIEGKENGNN